MSILVYMNVLRFNLRIDILNSIKAPWETTRERRGRELSGAIHVVELSQHIPNTKWKPIVPERCVSSRRAYARGFVVGVIVIVIVTLIFIR